MPTPRYTTSILALTRRSLGLCFLALGLAGVLLPILPGWPLLLVGGRMLGRRDPLLRRAGVRLLPHWRRTTRLLIG